MMNKMYSLILVVGLALSFSNSTYGQDELNLFSFEQVDSLIQVDYKPIVVFLHTDWCKYCHSMKETVFKDPEVINFLNENYYMVSFDAESEDDVSFAGNTFHYIPNGAKNGVHELATQLDGSLNFPSLCILNGNYELVFQYGGALYKEELMTVIKSL
jgi:thioredoxin-related protein